MKPGTWLIAMAAKVVVKPRARVTGIGEEGDDVSCGVHRSVWAATGSVRRLGV